jgi:hypothetical protein
MDINSNTTGGIVSRYCNTRQMSSTLHYILYSWYGGTKHIEQIYISKEEALERLDVCRTVWPIEQRIYQVEQKYI